MSSGI